VPDRPDDDLVRWDVLDHVATITLHRPERLNAWTWPMHARFFELVDRADDDPGVRAVVLTGSGRGFCPGMDMDTLAETSKTAGGATERRPFTELVDLRKPLIAAINGFFTLGQYSWMAVWLPELFPTRMRATGMAFVFNGPRFIAFLGPLLAGTLIVQFGGYGQAAMALALVYLVGIAAAPFVRETLGKPLPA